MKKYILILLYIKIIISLKTIKLQKALLKNISYFNCNQTKEFKGYSLISQDNFLNKEEEIFLTNIEGISEYKERTLNLFNRQMNYEDYSAPVFLKGSISCLNFNPKDLYKSIFTICLKKEEEMTNFINLYNQFEKCKKSNDYQEQDIN